MSFHATKLRLGLLGVLLPVAAGLGAPAAFASDPVPGDAIAPQPNVNIGLLYNLFSDAGTFGAVHGSNYTHNTRISTDIIVGRYIRTFQVGGLLAGVQAFVPYVTFLGSQELGVSDLGSAAPGLLPSLGSGRASLSHNSGFGQPNFGAFIFPVNDPAKGDYVVVGPWINPPISGFNKDYTLNPSQNVWTYELEAGTHLTLFGTPQTQNLSVEAWGAAYFYGSNHNSALDTPTVSANNIPAAYVFAHEFISPAIPDSNPVSPSTSTPASFHEQPTEEIHLYMPYEFAPAIGAFVVPGFYQSFGGKQTYTLRNGFKVDSGNRTDESQVRLAVSTFLTPSFDVLALAEYDVAAHGQPLNRTLLIRLAKFF